MIASHIVSEGARGGYPGLLVVLVRLFLLFLSVA